MMDAWYIKEVRNRVLEQKAKEHKTLLSKIDGWIFDAAMEGKNEIEIHYSSSKLNQQFRIQVEDFNEIHKDGFLKSYLTMLGFDYRRGEHNFRTYIISWYDNGHPDSPKPKVDTVVEKQSGGYRRSGGGGSYGNDNFTDGFIAGALIG